MNFVKSYIDEIYKANLKKPSQMIHFYLVVLKGK